jgi:uncharacterized membrane protein YfcA
MDGLNLAFFLAAAFFGGLTSGLSGFAMGLVVSGVWLHIIAPDQNALLIVLCGLVTQGSGIWRVRRAINWRAVSPFIIGGLTGLGGIAVTVWCQLRGGPKDAQRAVFQPVMFATFAMSAISFGFAGAFTVETFKLYALVLPVLIAGTWSGLRLYGKLDDAAFRKLILLLLLVSGLALIVPTH